MGRGRHDVHVGEFHCPAAGCDAVFLTSHARDAHLGATDCSGEVAS